MELSDFLPGYRVELRDPPDFPDWSRFATVKHLQRRRVVLKLDTGFYVTVEPAAILRTLSETA